MMTQPSGGRLADQQTAAAARRSAAGVRAEYLVSVSSGLLSVFDVLDAVVTEEGRPLLKVSIRQLLLSQEGWGAKRTDDTLAMLASFTDAPVAKMTIGWLTDPRAQGARLIAFADVMSPRRSPVRPPWPGFPFARNPQALEAS